MGTRGYSWGKVETPTKQPQATATFAAHLTIMLVYGYDSIIMSTGLANTALLWSGTDTDLIYVCVGLNGLTEKPRKQLLGISDRS